MSHCHFLEKLVNERKVRKFAEIGVYKGALTRHLLRRCRHLTEYYAIDSWCELVGSNYGRMNSEHKKQAEWDSIYVKVCRELPYHRPLKVIRLPALEAVKLFPLPQLKEFFDFIYIDTSHFYQNTLDEIKAYLPLVKKGGIIGGHDYAATRPEHQGVRKAVDEIFGAENIKQGDDMVWYHECR